MRKGFLGPLSTSRGRCGTCNGGMRGGVGGGVVVRCQELLLSPISTSQPELGQRPCSLSHSSPSPKCAKVPIPRTRPGLKNWDSQATNTQQDRLPLYSRKGHFIMFPFWLSDVRLVVSHVEQCWPPSAFTNTLILTMGLVQVCIGCGRKGKHSGHCRSRGLDWEFLFSLPGQLLVPREAHSARAGSWTC